MLCLADSRLREGLGVIVIGLVITDQLIGRGSPIGTEVISELIGSRNQAYRALVID
jgi:hypothetical protein